MTAIEYLVSELFKPIDSTEPENVTEIVTKAKEMEKQQIIDAYWDGGQDIPLTSERCEQYYNETFNN